MRTLCQRTASTEHTVSLHLTNNEGFALYHSTVRVNESWAAWEDCMPRVSEETLRAAQKLDTNGACVFSAPACAVNAMVLLFL